MIIDLTREDGRKGYFAPWSSHRILASQGDDRRRKALEKVLELSEEQPERVILGANDASSIDDLMSGQFRVDRRAAIDEIQKSGDDQLIVLPQNYRIGGFNTQHAMSYNNRTLMRVDHVAVMRLLFGNDYSRGGGFRFSHVEAESLTPEVVLRSAFNLLGECNPEQTRFAYAWKSPRDKGLRVVSPLRAIEAAEMRMYQDYVAWKVLAPELAVKKDKRSAGKLRRIQHYVAQYGAAKILEQLSPGEYDLIEKICVPHGHRTGWHVYTPSRGNPSGWHDIALEDMPILRGSDIDHELRFGWNIKAHDTGIQARGLSRSSGTEQRFREGRRSRRGQLANTDVFFTANTIAAAASVRTMHKYKPHGYNCGPLPFILPRAELMHFVDTLRYSTLILDQSGSRDDRKWVARPLNKTEINDWVMHRIAGDYDRFCSTDSKQLGLQGGKALIRFYT